ncbi:MAG: thioredoxin domain-containing protein [Gammaproteobacteria bacterium]|nr:thioredoxin domain-containing protein [Gammaproteobacteria bacterium]MCP4089578.1 thioredoxin domain-containing protein [Gammaproteobacteria bacterium]MCP4832469.1 thioredoxin domain-containing protein [Gammaproteobacteria bacterium]MCP4930161.1 thioredoxin domain-containing protein [Gammaproteobacteria bacterium]
MNHLQNETSPYLLQHADNPVDWYPWGEEALAKAKAENKPVLLSVGYSACHWCHVMAHESFEDEATAKIMNQLFINIKVDREERPDIDKIYQTAHQLITKRNGGWPLTVFMTPEQLPFMAGTYFPKTEMHGMPPFTDLLMQIAQYFETNQSALDKQGAAVVSALASLEPATPDKGTQLNRAPLEGLRQQLESTFDRDWGGFGEAPKFPHPTSIEYLLRHWRSTAHAEEPDIEALFMSALTVTRMIDGGIYDQLGGGFFRYSVDREWSIPHFEKMLYDNGPLLALLAQLWMASGDDAYRVAANKTADWVLRDMQSPEGAFWSTLDADSEGEEGKFYVWDPDEVSDLLSANEYKALATRFGLEQVANFEGQWHLQVRDSLEHTTEATGELTSTTHALIDSAQTKLLAARNKRIWPGRDEKILTAWNALMIRGLAMAGRSLNREDLITAAANTVDFIQQEMVINGQLLASYKDGQARFDAYLDDYAFLLDAILELLQARWNSQHLKLATTLAEQLLNNFADKENGGFYFTSIHHEKLIHRTRSFSDDSLPSGNAIAAFALSRLGHLLGEPRYLQASEDTLRAGFTAMQEFPHGHAALITALDEHLEAPEVIIIRGSLKAAEEWSRSISALYTPRRLVFTIPTDAELPESLASKPATSGTVAYLCRGTTCSAPIETLQELANTIRES